AAPANGARSRRRPRSTRVALPPTCASSRTRARTRRSSSSIRSRRARSAPWPRPWPDPLLDGRPAGRAEVARDRPRRLDHRGRDDLLATPPQHALARTRDPDRAHRVGVPVEDGRRDADLTEDRLLALERVAALADRRELALQRRALHVRVAGEARQLGEEAVRLRVVEVRQRRL